MAKFQDYKYNVNNDIVPCLFFDSDDETFREIRKVLRTAKISFDKNDNPLLLLPSGDYLVVGDYITLHP